MLIDTDKINCCTCKYYREYKNPPEVLAVLHSPGKLYACNGVDNFGIVGPKFYCAKHELVKK